MVFRWPIRSAPSSFSVMTRIVVLLSWLLFTLVGMFMMEIVVIMPTAIVLSPVVVVDAAQTHVENDIDLVAQPSSQQQQIVISESPRSHVHRKQRMTQVQMRKARDESMKSIVVESDESGENLIISGEDVYGDYHRLELKVQFETQKKENKYPSREDSDSDGTSLDVTANEKATAPSQNRMLRAAQEAFDKVFNNKSHPVARDLEDHEYYLEDGYEDDQSSGSTKISTTVTTKHDDGSSNDGGDKGAMNSPSTKATTASIAKKPPVTAPRSGDKPHQPQQEQRQQRKIASVTAASSHPTPARKQMTYSNTGASRGDESSSTATLYSSDAYGAAQMSNVRQSSSTCPASRSTNTCPARAPSSCPSSQSCNTHSTCSAKRQQQQQQQEQRRRQKYVSNPPRRRPQETEAPADTTAVTMTKTVSASRHTASKAPTTKETQISTIDEAKLRNSNLAKSSQSLENVRNQINEHQMNREQHTFRQHQQYQRMRGQQGRPIPSSASLENVIVARADEYEAIQNIQSVLDNLKRGAELSCLNPNEQQCHSRTKISHEYIFQKSLDPLSEDGDSKSSNIETPQHPNDSTTSTAQKHLEDNSTLEKAAQAQRMIKSPDTSRRMLLSATGPIFK